MIGNFIVWPLVILYLSHSYVLMIGLFVLLTIPVVLIALVYFGLRLFKQVRFIYDAFMARTPGIAGIAQGLAVSRFCRALCSLYDAGVPIATAVQYAAETCGNFTLGQMYKKAVVPLQRGSSLPDAFVLTRAFPTFMTSTLTTVQETGSLTPVLEKVAYHYEQDAKVRLGNLSMNVGIAITLISGLVMLLIDLFVYGSYLKGALNTGI
jgi:type II secretory pathway component PulF